MKQTIVLCLLIVISTVVFSQSWKTYPYSPAGSLISFPDDEGRHSSEPTEWWYTIGHLTGDSTGNHYSYMLTYFYSPKSGFDGFRILNLSDDVSGLFFDQTLPVNYNILATDSFNIEANIYMGGVETWRNKIDSSGHAVPFEYEISAAGAYGALNLEYEALKPPLILGDSGYLYQGATGYTYYYSQTKNAVTGAITFNGISENVSGISWIDRQYGLFIPSNGQEYEWFCIQLSNNMDINLNNIFTNDDKIPDTNTFKLLSVWVDDSTQHTTSDFEIERLKFNYMPDSLMCYSQKWRITSVLYNIDIIVTTLHSNYEVQLPFRFYEGPTTITGTVNGSPVTGNGFAELLHSYDKPDISITTPSLWDMSLPFIWKINNPDDGNIIYYDLEYSIDNQQTFLPLTLQQIDTFFYWFTPPLMDGDSCFMKVTGYSIDTTLIDYDIAKIFVKNTSISENGYQNLLSVYPNPSTGLLTIEGESIQTVKITGITGKLVFFLQDSGTKQTIDLSNYPKGIYYMNVTTDKGVITKKIILK